MIYTEARKYNFPLLTKQKNQIPGKINKRRPMSRHSLSKQKQNTTYNRTLNKEHMKNLYIAMTIYKIQSNF